MNGRLFRKKGFAALVGVALLIVLTISITAWAGQPGGKNDRKARPEKAERSPAAPAPESSGKAEESGTLNLDELLRTALEQNPSIRASREALEASRSMILPAGTLPEPTLTFEHMGDIIPLRLQAKDPASARTYGIEQEIPFPGKLGLKGKIAEAEAQAQEWNLVLVRRQVAAELKQAYYDLYLSHKTAGIIRRNKDLLQDLLRVAETKYQVGQGIQQDILKAQVEISKLIDRLLQSDQRRSIAEARINTLLHRPIESPLGKPAELKKAELLYSLEELNKLAEANSPTLKAQDSEVERRHQSVQLAAKEYYPDFAVGFTYYEREQQPEMYRLMVSAKVPLYFWRKQRPELEAARLNLSSARSTRASTQHAVQSELREAHIMATTADQLVKLYSTAVIPQTRLSMESALANYQVGRVDFLTLIDSLTAVLDYEMKYYESLADFQKALARMEPVVGVELTN